MRFLLALFLLLGITACQSTPPQVEVAATPNKVTFSEHDGLTKATAIVVSGAEGSREGVNAQYDWIDQHLPGSTVESVGLEGGDGIYDVFVLKLPSGTTRKLYFNITSYMHRQ